MTPSLFNRRTGLRIFVISFIAAFAAQYYPETKMLIWVTITFSFIFIVSGWYLFRSYFPEGSFPVLFLMGYLYSGVLIASVFGAKQWPLSGTMVPFSMAYVLVQFLIIIKIWKKLNKASLIQLLFEAGVMLGLSILLITRL